MSAIRFRKLSIWFIVFIIYVSICLVSSTVATSPSPMLYFQRSDNSSVYIGTLMNSGSWRLEDVRITLYDHNKQLMETAMLSEYSRNSDYGYFLGYKDLNENSRVDSPDTFYVYGKGEVRSSWGIVLTYDKTGRTLTSSTISGEHFSLEDDKEYDSKMMIRHTVLILMILNLLIILAVVYKMPCV